MASLDQLIPNYVIERSLAFKSFVIIVGALLLLISTFIRDTFPVLWILPFLGGALIEWFVVATVYVEISQIEEMIAERKNEINKTQSEIESTKNEIEETQTEIEKAKENVFSFASDSQGPGMNNSIEDRISDLENEVGVNTMSGGSLSDRIDSLERDIQELKRDQGGRW